MFKKKNENSESIFAQNELGAVLKKTGSSKPKMTDEQYLSKHKKFKSGNILRPEVDESMFYGAGVFFYLK